MKMAAENQEAGRSEYHEPGKTEGRRKGALQRIVHWGVLAGIAYLVVQVIQGQPVEVEVVYHYGAASKGLVQAHMRYLRGEEEVRRIKFDYSRQPAMPTQIHRVNLMEGLHVVEIDLSYASQAPAEVGGSQHALPGGGVLVRLRRTLIVKGSGRVSVFTSAP